MQEDNHSFDYIIIGAGTAGCLMANRLSADASKRVLLIEAGRKDDYHWIHIPVGYLYCIGNPRTDWLYSTEPDAGLNGRSLRYPRGKTLGGSSSINGMIYMRGQARDYDQWAQLTGDMSWRWENTLPYFKLLEIYRVQGDEEAYERTRERFNQRFNAFAPDWGGDLASGRLLEDYPEVVQRLQRAWLQPLRAVAELDALLLRRADLEPLDLPAYREILMLHALVRDLPAGTLHAATTTVSKMVAAVLSDPAPAPAPEVADDAVDVLLPLGDGPLDITLPRPHISQRSSAQAMLAEWVFTRTTQPRAAAGVDPADRADAAVLANGRFDEPSSRPVALDLDLSELAPAPREFTQPAAFTDIDLRRDGHRSDLGALEDGHLAPPLSRR